MKRSLSGGDVVSGIQTESKKSEFTSSQVPISDEMNGILAHQKEIKSWLALVQQKIYELETSYMDETNSMGNIIKGWDPDGRSFPIRRGPLDDKDRLFSNSSFTISMAMKNQEESELERKHSIAAVKSESLASGTAPTVTYKPPVPKLKKMKKLEDAWEHYEEF